MPFLLQAEFSLLDFKATDESTKVELPLYIEVKGERISTGCGSLTVRLLSLFSHCTWTEPCSLPERPLRHQPCQADVSISQSSPCVASFSVTM